MTEQQESSTSGGASEPAAEAVVPLQSPMQSDTVPAFHLKFTDMSVCLCLFPPAVFTSSFFSLSLTRHLHCMHMPA